MTLAWKNQLDNLLIDEWGKKKGEELSLIYIPAFSESYMEQYPPEQALKDIDRIQTTNQSFVIDFYERKNHETHLNLRLFQFDKTLPLSDILKILENMGLRTYSSSPALIKLTPEKTIQINNFVLQIIKKRMIDIQQVKAIFEETLEKILLGEFENDGFNQLVLSSGLNWREVGIIRALAKYMHQIRFRFSQAYIESIVELHREITTHIVQLFIVKFSPEKNPARDIQMDAINQNINQHLEEIASFDEDAVIRCLWNLTQAMLRTNYFQTTNAGRPKEYLAFKFDDFKIPDLPVGKPLYEIFVYSSRFEGVHLRSSKISRGGIRWSERLEDYRSEILSLMKAQKVKNSIIVPSGAKGGFILKYADARLNASDTQREVTDCYRLFICGLLDLTDNLKNNQIISPPQTLCYDHNDPYLVVAADKGTAQLSDLANCIAKEYDFWLGDAFASGGSTGYDHKKMGITARGAWESIKRHFRTLNLNYLTTPFTVVGIGDMSGDVFGNGMLYTPNIRLIAAFDHRNIFLDPNPNHELAYYERQRLFSLPRSSWEDYNPALISKGGGVFKRFSKQIVISPEIKKALAIDDDLLSANELVMAILKAPVNLLFNGGIGTYVKASTESNLEVGDKFNEYCRVNGSDLRCCAVGEGGNLGFTQLGRVEFALQGGLINTDFIDNSGGVDCSDREVNIKILLNHEIDKGRLSLHQRNQLLIKMTSHVAQMVLMDNFNQADILCVSALRSLQYSGLYINYIQELERVANLDRASEGLPTEKKLLERRTSGRGLTLPELAVLLSYSKIYITNELLKSKVPDQETYYPILKDSFPPIIAKRFAQALHEHPLRREIIATQLSNQIINCVGITFFSRMQLETGASIPEIAEAYRIATQVYRTEELSTLINSLDFNIAIDIQQELQHHIRQLLNLATRWFLRNKRLNTMDQSTILEFTRAIKKLEHWIPRLMVGLTKDYMNKIIDQFTALGIAEGVARRTALTRAMYTALNVTEVAKQNHFDLIQTAKVYFAVGGEFNLVWFRDQIQSDRSEGHWNSMARLALRDELDNLQRHLTIVILNSSKKNKRAEIIISNWISKNPQINQRWENLLEMLHASDNTDYTMFFIAIRELADMLKNVS